MQEEIFNYIHNILSMPGYSPEEKRSVWDKTLHHIKVRQGTPQESYFWLVCILYAPSSPVGLTWSIHYLFNGRNWWPLMHQNLLKWCRCTSQMKSSQLLPHCRYHKLFVPIVFLYKWEFWMIHCQAIAAESPEDTGTEDTGQTEKIF